VVTLLGDAIDAVAARRGSVQGAEELAEQAKLMMVGTDLDADEVEAAARAAASAVLDASEEGDPTLVIGAGWVHGLLVGWMLRELEAAEREEEEE
jgi:hypothetical protein